jgi:predicted ATPase
VLTALAVENCRSLRRLVLPLAALNMVTGAYGSGKSSLYRALRLLADSSRNGAVAALAREGGLPSTLWAGPETIGRSVREGRYPVQGTRRRRAVRLRLGFGADDFSYAIDFGLPVPGQTAFALDPEIKRECIWNGPVLRPSAVRCDRQNTIVRVRNDDGTWASPSVIRSYDSMLSEFADPQRAPEVLSLRERIRSWRFYDYFRTDAMAPAGRSQVATRTPVLGPDGADLSAALQTIREIGDAEALDTAVDLAFPRSQVSIERDSSGRLDLRLRQRGLLRPLGAAELSDGTLRYLLWIAALLTPRPPGLLVLNEPETSLHSDLLEPLTRLISNAAAHSQIITVSHSRALINALSHAAHSGGTEVATIGLFKEFGETCVAGAARTHLPPLHNAGLVELVSEETEVLPGVRLLPAPGHTPGHLVAALTSGYDGALYLGDAVLDEANLAHPGWVTAIEWNPGMAVATRTALLEQAIAEHRLLIAFHLAARGYAERADGSYRLRHVGAEVPAAR